MKFKDWNFIVQKEVYSEDTKRSYIIALLDDTDDKKLDLIKFQERIERFRSRDEVIPSKFITETVDYDGHRYFNLEIYDVELNGDKCIVYFQYSKVEKILTLEGFMDWYLDGRNKDLKCVHGGLCGGPGYIGFGSCKIHGNVRYGCDTCPKDCSDYKDNSVGNLAGIYKHLYGN